MACIFRMPLVSNRWPQEVVKFEKTKLRPISDMILSDSKGKNLHQLSHFKFKHRLVSFFLFNWWNIMNVSSPIFHLWENFSMQTNYLFFLSYSQVSELTNAQLVYSFGRSISLSISGCLCKVRAKLYMNWSQRS